MTIKITPGIKVVAVEPIQPITQITEWLSIRHGLDSWCRWVACETPDEYESIEGLSNQDWLDKEMPPHCIDGPAILTWPTVGPEWWFEGHQYSFEGWLAKVSQLSDERLVYLKLKYT